MLENGDTQKKQERHCRVSSISIWAQLTQRARTPILHRSRDEATVCQDYSLPTRNLLEHWTNPDRETKLFFYQIQAIETLIWVVEAPESEKQGIKIEGDGSPFQRLCSKMATGSSARTIFKKNVVVTPGLTVKSRLKVLYPSDSQNYQLEFDLVPSDIFDKLRQGKVKIINQHMLSWESEDQIKKKKSG